MSLSQEDADTADKALPVLYGAPEGYDGLVLAERARELAKDKRAVIHVALDDRRIETLKAVLDFFASDVEVAVLPAWDCLPYDRVSPHSYIVASRIEALSQCIGWQEDRKYLPRILLTSVNAITQKVMPSESLKKLRFGAQKDGEINHDELRIFLTQNGYTRTNTVREPGEYSIRGGIIDLFPPGYGEPLRIDTFGDDVESIRTFDPLVQTSTGEIESFSLLPAAEFELSEESIARFRSAYREIFGTTGHNDPLYEAVSEGRRYNGMEHWLPLFHDKMETVLDYIPDSFLSFDFHTTQARVDRMDQVRDFYQARQTLEKSEKGKAGNKGDISLAGSVYHPLSPEYLYLSDTQWKSLTEGRQSEVFSPFRAPDTTQDQDAGGRKGRDFADIRSQPDADVMGELKSHLIKLMRRHDRVVIAGYSEGAKIRMKELFEASGIDFLRVCEAHNDVRKLNKDQVGLVVLPLESGFESPSLALLTEFDVLGDRLTQKSRKRKKADQFLTEVSSLTPGDLVVHIDHGIGRFDKLETLTAAGTLHDCLQITYAGGDRLFVPVENIEVLSRFGSDEGTVQLDKMGGAGWQARKAKVKQDLMAIAGDLLKVAAERHLKDAEKIDVSQDLYNDFKTRFPFAETEDQERAIQDVIADLSAGRPMDRLICGDVGFGKTEVALRAAYFAALNGLQVAVIVPTTLLARQHYTTFQKRFEGMGLRIDQLSRMVSQTEAQKTKEGLRDGTVNIVIGTHALLSKNIKFDNLGLLIVDEEQKFGVKQKERLKEMRTNIHILTLTATPIPRTLQLSLTGVKELSLIATPPVDRLAVRTFILPFDPMVVREAILREHYRGGQTFYVCPRISDIQEIEKELQELVPEVKVVTAHGQMSSGELEDKMNAFYDGQYGILLATNIIESGLDIPTANTMIIHRSDMFGLGQLYQLRGRIGRSKLRAYAYLTYQPKKKLSDNAFKRLEVMETLDTLGAGFQLASYDMDIRGAGNLLGEEQSGHIKEVGIELYQQMLEEAVAAAKENAGEESGAEIEDSWSPQINLGTSVLIPDTYIEDLNLRMSLYRRLGNLTGPEDIDMFAAELIDRFGDIPSEVQNLLDIVEIKQACRVAGVDKVEAGPKGAVIGFHKDHPPNLEGLVAWMGEKGGAVKLRPDQKIAAIRQWSSAEQRVKGVRALVKELAEL